MWLLPAALLVVTLSPSPAPMPPASVRAVSPSALALITDATTRSAIVCQQIEQLAATDAIVYVEIVASPEIPLARTKLVAGSADVRFLRVSINARIASWDRIALLAHELQHALEIAGAPEVRDDEGVRQLYARIGYDGGPNRYETAAARQVEWRVRAEVARHSRVAATRADQTVPRR
jgi:hypothetical protein